MVWVRSPVYFYNRNGTYYFSRAVPSDLRHRFPKRKIEVSLRTKSESKAARSAFCEVVNTFFEENPSDVSATTSVNVPPMSIATLTIKKKYVLKK